MSLPKLNVAKYETKIPSTGKTVKFRPYLVKEEKILFLAQESADDHQKMSAISDIVESCIEDNIDISSLTTFDIEYLFLKMRSKSVGEAVNLSVSCSECKQENEYSLNLDDIKIDIPKSNFKIVLNDQVSLKMKWPSYVNVTNSGIIASASNDIERVFGVTIQCIESIQTENENFLIKDTPEAEVVDFLESLNSEQYRKLSDFISEMPKLHHKIEFDCAQCKTHNTYDLEGIGDFF